MKSGQLGQLSEHFLKPLDSPLRLCEARPVQLEILRRGHCRLEYPVKLSQEVRSTHSQDGAVVLDIRHGRMFRLNLVGSRMLELLSVGCSEGQISDQISREFSVAREIVEADVHEFLTHLERHHLLDLGQREAHTR